MPSSEFSLLTNDELTLRGIDWPVSGSPKAVVLIVHGLGEHIHRYEHVAAYLNKSNISVIGYDQRSHGKSDGIRGHASSYNELINDLQDVVLITRNKYPDKPIFFYGHSLGGSLVLYNELINPDQDINGMIVSSPGLSTAKPVSPILSSTGRILSKLWPAFQLNNGLDFDGLSHDQNIIKSYIDDPLVHDKISAHLGIELIDKGKYIVANAKDIKHPVLFIQGSQDRLVNPVVNKSFYESLTTKKELIWREDGYHESHNEPFKSEILKNITEWIMTNI